MSASSFLFVRKCLQFHTSQMLDIAFPSVLLEKSSLSIPAFKVSPLQGIFRGCLLPHLFANVQAEEV